MRKSFTWFLSLLVLLVAFATRGFAQEDQETVELYAEVATDCYNESNNYTVTIAVKDFIKLSRFALELSFNDAIFQFDSISSPHAVLDSAGINASESGGTIDITWDGNPTTIGNDVKTNIMVLHFSLLGYPGNIATSFASAMQWDVSDFWYDIPTAPFEDAVNTVIAADGSLTVNVELDDITTATSVESCNGGDVTLTVTAPGATMYLFNEDNDPANWAGAWSASNTYLTSAGETVTVRVKDANGCMSTQQIIDIPATIDPVAFSVTTQDPNCYGGNGSVVINVTGGTAPYNYYIATDTTGVITPKNNFQFSMAPGTYYVNVQDANDCASLPWEMITITDTNMPVTGSVSPTNVACNGGDDGAIAVTILENGGAPADINDYQVSVDGGTTWEAPGVTLIDSIPAGDYDVVVRNISGCEVIIGTVTLTEPEEITFDVAIDDVSCGQLGDGAIHITNIMPAGPTYEVSVDGGTTWIADGSGSDENTNSGEITVGGLDPRYYSIDVRAVSSTCAPAEYDNPNGSGNVVAVQSPESIHFDIAPLVASCHDAPVLVDVQNITPSSGTYVILFNGFPSTETDKSTFVWDAPYAPLEVTVENASGDACGVTQTLNDTYVDNPDVLMASITDVYAPTCIDGNDGNVYLNITGGTLPYEYTINGSAPKTTSNTLTVVKVGVGVHIFTVTDANGCTTTTDAYSVTVTMDENIIDADSVANISCNGAKDGLINVNFTSWADGLAGIVPNRDVKYWVENEDGVVSSFGPANIAAPADVTTFYAGTYIIWVEDQYTCESNKDTVEVTESDELLIVDVNANGASCYQTYDGIMTIIASGGYVNGGVLNYAIVNNQGALENLEDDDWFEFTDYDSVHYDPARSSVSFYVDGGTYWIAVRDSGCNLETYGPIEVTGYEQLLVDEMDIEPMDPMCNGEATGSISVPPGAVSGGAGAYKYSLLDASLDTITAYYQQASGDFAGLPAGTYSVLVEDAEDCTPYTTAPIDLVDPDPLTFTASYQHMSCLDANDGTIKIDVTGGTPGYKYAINSTGTWFNFGYNGNTPITSKTYIATEPGMFRVWVKDANECITGPDTITILEPTALSAAITVSNVLCNGATNGQISIVPSGGWAGYTSYEFKVDNGAWTSSTTIGSLAAGNHVLSIRDVYNYASVDTLQPLDCVYTKNFTITQPKVITYDVDIKHVSCKDGADGWFVVNVLSGGTPFNETGTALDGYDVRLTGNAYDSGFLRTGDDNSIIFKDLAPSHYTVYIKDANGCTLKPTAGNSEGPYTTIESWELNEPDDYLDFEAEWLSDVTCYNGEDGSLAVHATGGTAPYKYFAGLSIPPNGGGHILVPAPDEDSDEWMDSDTLMVGAGTWVVWVMDANGCIKGGETDDMGAPVIEWRVEVAQPDQILWSFHMAGSPLAVHYIKPSCFGSWNGEIHLVGSTGVSGTPITGGSGTYNARVWGAAFDGSAVDTTYNNIKPNSGLYKLGGLPASDTIGFEVTVTDANGCTSTIDTIFVDQPEMLTVDLQKVDGFQCYGDVDGQIEAYPDGGTAPYQYQLWKNGAVHTPWQSLGSSFLVQAGNTFVIGVKDAKGCEARDTIYIETPQMVEYTYDRLTCNGDTKASVRINATGTSGREFTVWYQEINDGVPAGSYTKYNGTFTSSIEINDVFLFDNENFIDRHYAVYVEDDEGCPSLIDTLTFDAVATELEVDVVITDITECTETLNISYMGGTAPYVVMVDDSVLTDDAYLAGRGARIVTVMDAHECMVKDTIMVEGMYVTRDTMIETYFERSTHFVDVEAGVDMMLAVGKDTFTYDYSDNCKRTLIVDVVEVSPAADIMEIQGETSSSPWVGYIVEVTGTITGISPNEGFYMQDANEAWSGVWVQWLNTGNLHIGDGVKVKGPVAEVSDVTTINATSVSGATAPVMVEPVVLGPAEVEDEMWESVMVKVEAATATAADNVTGEWVISHGGMFDDVIVNDQMFSFHPVATHIYDVSGVVSGRLDVYKIEPRMMSDIVPAAIKTVQGAAASSPYVGRTLELSGTVSGVSSGEGFFMQDANEAWSGIWVQWINTADLAVGDGVKVTGPIAEVSDVTTINATSVVEGTSDLTLEPIVLGSPSELEDEQYESVLVMVEGARGTAADDVTGEWTIYYEMMDDATVNDLMYSYEPTDGNYYDVTGVVNGRLDNYKLEPRMEDDIVDLTATPADRTPLNVEFGVYPNPFNDRINLKNSDKLSRVVISNIAGQRVIDIKYPNSEIRTAKLVSGVYIVSMYTENGIAKSVRIVKR